GLVSWRRAAAAQRAAERERDVALARASAADAAADEVFHRLPVAAARVDGDGRLTGLTRMLTDIFPDVAPGESLPAAFGSHELSEAVAQIGQGAEARAVEVRLFGEERRTFRVAVEPRERDDGPGATLIFSDLSEAVAYRELRSQFVANVSHELRSPLTGLRGLLEALEDGAMGPDERAGMVDRAAREARRLEAILVDVLLLSELEAGDGLPAEEGCDLADAVVEAVEEAAGFARAQGVALSIDVPEYAPVPVTASMARTLVRNLVQNAARYAGSGSVARVEVRRGPAEVTLTVSDDGAGIPERHLPHVFERFYRADPSRSRELGGTGLGLSIVKHIAERFGGRAEVRSREGYGTEIHVMLPLADPPEVGSAPPFAGEGR
ncbi:MAG: sensor histidine kinase, partial [Miltoncostaeaceae bacterium]